MTKDEIKEECFEMIFQKLKLDRELIYKLELSTNLVWSQWYDERKVKEAKENIEVHSIFESEDVWLKRKEEEKASRSPSFFPLNFITK